MDQSQSPATRTGRTSRRQRQQEPEFQPQDLTQRRTRRQTSSTNPETRPPSRAESVISSLSSVGSTASRIVVDLIEQIPPFLPEPGMATARQPSSRPESRASLHSQRSESEEPTRNPHVSESEDEEEEEEDTVEATPRPTSSMPGRYPAPKEKGKESQLSRSEREELIRLRQKLAIIEEKLKTATAYQPPSPYQPYYPSGSSLFGAPRQQAAPVPPTPRKPRQFTDAYPTVSRKPQIAPTPKPNRTTGTDNTRQQIEDDAEEEHRRATRRTIDLSQHPLLQEPINNNGRT